MQTKQKEDGIDSRKRQFTDETETSEDDLGIGKGTSDQEASPRNINRRKTQHTKILSDDKIIRTTASTSGAQNAIRRTVTSSTVIGRQINKSPLTQNHQKLQTSAPTRTYSISSQSRVIGGANKPAILRPPPRILNSQLCNPSNKPTVPSLVTKLVTKDDYENDANKIRNNNIISSRSKENNVTSYTYTEKDGKMIPKKPIANQLQQQQKQIQQRKPIIPLVRSQAKQQKFISEPVSMNSRCVRKITCYETWFVIKMAEEQPKAEKSVLNLSLMQIGNEIKKIELPSSDWTYKILLQPLSKQLLALRKTTSNDTKLDQNKKLEANKSALKDSKADDDKQANDKDEKTNDKPNDDRNESEDSANDDNNKSEEKSETKVKNANESSETEDSKNDEKPESNEIKENAEKDENENENSAKSEKTDDSDAKESSSEKDETNKKEKTEVKLKQETTDEESKSTSDENKPSNAHDQYTGEVHDPNINHNERHNYRPINIMFRRKCLNPNIRIQYDRTVILKNQTFYLNVDGKNVRLIASPQSIESYDDIKTLLQIVNDASLSNCCVELSTHIV